ncbi:MAG: hypothetical protein Q8N84_04245 [bacterium]|nr:hypothetical protein [bacterium]
MAKARKNFAGWWLVLILLASLPSLACENDGNRDGNPGGDQPVQRCYHTNIFRYQPGTFPHDMQQFGTDKTKVEVTEYQGNNWLKFQSQEGANAEKFATWPQASCSGDTVSVKVLFLTNQDYGGLVVAYEGEDTYIRVALNPFNDLILVEEKRHNANTLKEEKPYPIDINRTYLLKVDFNYSANSLKVYLDGQLVGEYSGFTKLGGQYGLTTHGLNPPTVLFDDLTIDSQPKVVGPTKILPTPTPTVGPINLVTDGNGLLISETDIWPEETVRVQFTVINQGNQPVKLRALLVVGRGPNGDTDNQDFDPVWDLTIPAGKSYTYEAKRSFSKLGKYLFVATYNPYGGGFPAVPTPKENIPNRYEAKVREMTEMERKGTNLLKPRFGFSVKEGDMQWTSEELDWLKEIFQLLPANFHNIPALEKIRRVHTVVKGDAEFMWFERCIRFSDRAYDPRYPGPSGDTAVCQKYVTWEKTFKGIAVHEALHAFQSSDIPGKRQIHLCANSLLKDYAAISDWKIVWKAEPCEYAYTGKNEDLPSYGSWTTCNIPRARESILEDLSEAARLYVMAPDYLRTNPRYNFLKESVFGGKEY